MQYLTSFHFVRKNHSYAQLKVRVSLTPRWKALTSQGKASFIGAHFLPSQSSSYSAHPPVRHPQDGRKRAPRAHVPRPHRGLRRQRTAPGDGQDPPHGKPRKT